MPAPPRMARHASTLLLIPQDRPRISPRTADPANVASLTPRMWLHLLCKPSVIMAAPGHFFGGFLLGREEVSAPFARPAGITKARRRRRAFGFALGSGRAPTPPLPPPPRLRPRPHPRPPRAWDRGGDPWQARLRSP